MKSRPFAALCGAVLAALLTLQTPGFAQRGAQSITPAEVKEYLSYIASDELQGRQIFTEGLGLAGGYIADHLKEWGLKPGGDDGTYFQTVKVRWDADCPVCGKSPTITELIDYEAFCGLTPGQAPPEAEHGVAVS